MSAAAKATSTATALGGGSTGPFALSVGETTEINAIIANALREDLGGFGSLGDVTTLSTVAPHITATARFLAKADGVLAGLCVAQLVFDAVDKHLQTDWTMSDGDAVKAGQYFGSVSGNARSIIIAERLALNLLQRMSGIATVTRRMVDATKQANTHTRILDTRKTLPGLRVVEKLAVRMGGGTNHRFGLFDMVMVKDNHVSASGGVPNAVRNIHHFLAAASSASASASASDNKTTGKSGGSKGSASGGASGGASATGIAIELETRTLDEVKQALALGGVDRIMLDNMVKVNATTGAVDTSMLAAAVKLIAAHNANAKALSPNQTGTAAAAVAAAAADAKASGKAVPTTYPKRVIETEASGNVTLATVAAIAATGVDFISSGALTHSAIALDISLKIVTAKL